MFALEGATFSHYRIQHLLTRGGMAEVYLAQDTDTDQQVAIKMVHRSSGDYYERCRREVAAVALLKHNHILPALDCGEYESWYYLVTPYIEGGTLQNCLAQGPMTLEEAGKILEQLVAALQFSHDHGILHRDIKASNVFLRAKDYIYLADFGLVKNIENDYSITQSGYLIGTPEYMAPELVDLPATISSDIYALGILLYQMLTGRVPFTGGTPVAVCLKHIREQPVPPSHLNPLIPPAIEAVVLRALEKDPGKRFQSAQDLLRAYQEALISEMSDMTVRVAAVHPAEAHNHPSAVASASSPAAMSAFAEAPTMAAMPSLAAEATVPRVPVLTEEEPTVLRAPAVSQKTRPTRGAVLGLLALGLLIMLLLSFSMYGLSSQISPLSHPGNLPHASPTIISTPSTVPINQQTPRSPKHHPKKGDATPPPTIKITRGIS
ncbi:MAG TPA: serine/threonine-protein kinase [Ktedonobacteraceae bacterium]|nr:serine/threonine-protein kinase [Ktedonobacteraceae bacterium]